MVLEAVALIVVEEVVEEAAAEVESAREVELVAVEHQEVEQEVEEVRPEVVVDRQAEVDEVEPEAAVEEVLGARAELRKSSLNLTDMLEYSSQRARNTCLLQRI